MNETRTLAEFASALDYSRLPSPIVARAKELILDQLTIQIGLSRLPWLAPAHIYATEQQGAEEATIAGHGNRTTAESAAFVNGTFGHGFELDDVYAPALAHPGPAIVPAALAVAERQHASGRAFITAVVAGYELMGRIGRALAPALLYRGFFPTSVSGCVGAAAAAGNLLRLKPASMIDAIGVAANLSSGLTEHLRSGGEVKRYLAGTAAANGVRAARLAELGLTGPSTVVEGDFGMRIFTNEYVGDDLLTELGERFVVGDIWQKKYGFNGMLHAPVDALHRIKEKHPVDGDRIAEIAIGSNRHAVHAVGRMRTPTDVFSFQFSAYYVLALEWLKGAARIDDFCAATLEDAAVSTLASKIRVETNADIDRLFPQKLGATVTLRTCDGECFSETVEDCRGSPGNPMSESERIEKARAVAAMTMQAPKIDRLIDRTDQLERLDDVRDLSALISSGSHSSGGRL